MVHHYARLRSAGRLVEVPVPIRDRERDKEWYTMFSAQHRHTVTTTSHLIHTPELRYASVHPTVQIWAGSVARVFPWTPSVYTSQTDPEISIGNTRTWTGPTEILQKLLDVPLFSEVLHTQERATVHLTHLLSFPEGHAARHVAEVCDFIARLLRTAMTHCLA